MHIEKVEFGLLIALICVSAIALLIVYKRDLLMLQLNSYRNERYVRWFNNSNESTTTNRILCCVALFAILVRQFPFYGMGSMAIICVAIVGISLLRVKYKKPLVFTSRAKRIYGVMIALSTIIAGGLSFFGLYWTSVALLVMLVVSPMILLLANILLSPVEKSINKKYYNDAARILKSMPDLQIIGVTGSYGKTSTKHYLYRILQEKFDVVMTPGSYNTTMGVIRTVREYLKPYNEVFIVEMGAKQPGDIKEICDLVKPQIGIVTAVGEQHLESFKTVERVQQTKFELIDSLPADGLAIVNDDFEYVANREVNNVKIIRYGVRNTENCSYVAKDIVVTARGTSFTVVYPDGEIKLQTRLVGECNISNLVAAVAAAINLGVEPQKIAYAVEKIEQVEHRLNMKTTAGGVVIIDDAFNSNPTGSKMALEVLGSFTDGKRVVVTPGMIELGDRQSELNREFGRAIAKNCDIAIIVGEYNREAIVSGILEAGFPEENIIEAATFTEAQSRLLPMLKAGDAVLYENDLPDTFK